MFRLLVLFAEDPACEFCDTKSSAQGGHSLGNAMAGSMMMRIAKVSARL